MKKWLGKWWKDYKYRFVPWIALNVKKNPPPPQNYPKQHQISSPEISLKQKQSQGESQHGLSLKSGKVQSVQHQSNVSEAIPVEYVSKSDDRRITDSQLRNVLINFLQKCHYPSEAHLTPANQEILCLKNLETMQDHFGFTVKRCKSLVSPEAGTGVFINSGTAKAGSVVALYPGTLYMPYEPLFFPSLGNPFIFRCSDGIHVDGNDRWISKSIFKSCAARDKFDFDTPCCDTSWLTSSPINPMNVGQYVNNRSRTQQNNVVYQECQLLLPPRALSTLDKDIPSEDEEYFPIELFKFLPNVWSDPNNKFRLRVIPLIAVRDIHEGEEILSSYFTVVHSEQGSEEGPKVSSSRES